jgi:membrane-anchored protein YejM (alkaline phosphatase superfamily)
MAFADLILGEVREQMERQGDWEGAVVVITSDHWQRTQSGENLPLTPRKYDHLDGYRVPLLVKWPGHQAPYRMDRPVSNLSVRRMVEAVAAGVPGGPDFPMDPPPKGIADLLVRPQGR